MTRTASDPALIIGGFDRTAVSGDGRQVLYVGSLPGAFASQANLFDVVAGVSRVLSVSSFGDPGNLSSFGVAISADGRWGAWESAASNLVDGDSNGASDVFVRGPSP